MSTQESIAGTPPAVLLERRGPALWMYLNRPQTLNGICLEIVDGLAEGLDAAEADDTIRVLVLSATGRAFCAGADLKYVLQMVDPDGHQDGAARLHTEFTNTVGRLFQRIEAFPKPVVAAVQGIVLAGGLELALCADIVIAAESARFGDAHANFGLLPGAGGSIRLPKRVGLSTAKRLMFTGDTVPATDLLGTDLVSQVVPDPELEAATQALVDTIAVKSPLGLRVMKHLANSAGDIPHAEGLALEADAVGQHLHSADFTEGIRAFNEKRAPHFTGR